MGRTKKETKITYKEFGFEKDANIASGRAYVDNATTSKSGCDIIPISLTINGLAIVGAKVISSDKGAFISFPQYKGKDGEYHSLVYMYEKEDLLFLNELAAVIVELCNN